MILIFDDTFDERKADYPMDFLELEKYSNVIKIFSKIKGNEIKPFEALIKEASCIACHRTIKFYGNSGNALSREQNINISGKLESYINSYKKPYISFSGSNTMTNLLGDYKLIINKRQFYYNLQNFADYFIDENNTIEFKVLTYGKNWIGYELSVIQSNIFYILNKNSACQTLDEFECLKTKLFSELIRFNEVSNLFAVTDLWLKYLKSNFKEICFLRLFIEKTVKSYIKYGKYIHNL